MTDDLWLLAIGRTVPGGKVHHSYHPDVLLVGCGAVSGVLTEVLRTVDERDSKAERAALVELGLKSEDLCGSCYPLRAPFWRRFRQELRGDRG